MGSHEEKLLQPSFRNFKRSNLHTDPPRGEEDIRNLFE